MTSSPKLIFALLGFLGLWILVNTILDFRRGAARRRDGTIYFRAERPNDFKSTMLLNSVVATAFVVVAIGVIFLDWPVKK